jgi:hypothetical protein
MSISSLLFASVCVLASLMCVSAGGLVLPQAYTCDVILSLPLGEVVETAHVQYDVNQGSAIVYNGGNAVYLQSVALQQQFETVWTTLANGPTQPPTQTCLYQSLGTPVRLTSAVPDTSQYTLVSASVSMGGYDCQLWQYEHTDFGYNSTYKLYVRASADGSAPIPVRAITIGHNVDILGGSHPDEYTAEYKNFVWGSPPASAFQKPSTDCLNEFSPSGPSMHERGPGADFDQALHPGHEGAQEDAFGRYKDTHGRTYEAGSSEHIERRRRFHAHSQLIRSKNRQGLSYDLAMNHFGDRTPEELKQMRGRRYNPNGNKAQAYHTRTMKDADLPTSWDWRALGAVVPVGDQATCGSCWSWAAAEAIASAYFLVSGNLTRISEQVLMDCSWTFGNLACDGGEASAAYDYVLSIGGEVPTWESYGGYTGQDGYCHWKNGVPSTATVGAKMTGYVNVTSGDLNAVMDALVTKGALAVGIDASLPDFYFYHSGIYSNPSCANTNADLDHAVLLVAADETSWTIRNSWAGESGSGSGWGMNGDGRILKAGNLCGVATDAVYVIAESL